MCGKYDLTVNIDLTREYYNHLHAPLKGFYTFENSAHGPLFEEPERFRKILENDVLNNDISLADWILFNLKFAFIRYFRENQRYQREIYFPGINGDIQIKFQTD